MSVPTSPLLALINSGALDASKMLEVFQSMHESYQSNETERAKIASNRDVNLELIRSQREILLKTIDRVFDERASVVRNQFDALDYALKQQDPETIKLALDGLVDLHQCRALFGRRHGYLAHDVGHALCDDPTVS